MVRYEDLLLHPVNSLKFLSSHFDWNGVELLHDDVIEWLEKNTRMSAGSQYSTRRNTTEQMFKWRREISLTMAKDIQLVCNEMMTKFEYINVSSESELLNFSLSLMNSFS